MFLRWSPSLATIVKKKMSSPPTQDVAHDGINSDRNKIIKVYVIEFRNVARKNKFRKDKVPIVLSIPVVRAFVK